MRCPRFSPRPLPFILAAAVMFNSTSCGTLLHPERRGQPPGGRLDPAIVLLDAAGLLLFLIPGLVAFAVDFSTGAIYLPPDYNWAPHAAHSTSSPSAQSARLVKVQLAKEELTRSRIEEVVREKTGRPVDLEPGRYRADRLKTLDQFDERSRKLAEPSDSAPATQIVFP
jgi:hypothetical protein